MTGKADLSGASADALQKDYGVIAYAPAHRQFATLFLDITDRRRREDALRKTNLRLDVLSETASQLLKTESPEALVDSLCRKVMEFMDCQVFFNYLVEDGKPQLHLNAYAGIPEDEAHKIEWLDYGAAVCGRAALQGRPLVCRRHSGGAGTWDRIVASPTVSRPMPAIRSSLKDASLGTLSFGTRNRAAVRRRRYLADENGRRSGGDRDRPEAGRGGAAQGQYVLEQRIAERTSELQQASLYARSLIEASLDPLVTISPEGKITDVNKATELAPVSAGSGLSAVTFPTTSRNRIRRTPGTRK